MTDTTPSTTQEGRDWSLSEEALSEGPCPRSSCPTPTFSAPSAYGLDREREATDPETTTADL
jgi:hypothetical protein